MGLIILILLVLVVTGVVVATRRGGPPAARPDDARAEADRWVARLGGAITNLDGAGNTAATQALADAAERHGAALTQLAMARTPVQYDLVSQTAIEGLHYIKAARTALGLDPGPGLPDAGTGRVAQQIGTVIGDQEYLASPQPGDATPYYYPGGVVGGRAVPAGWYSQPWWKTALVAGAAGAGGMLLMDALFGDLHHHMPMGGGFGGGPGGGFGGGFFGGGPF